MTDEELLDELGRALDDMPDTGKAAGFHDSVSEKASSMREYLDANGELTDRQVEALENMLAGVRRWIR